MTYYYHVFTPEGDVYISDDAAGIKRLGAFARAYPTATVIMKDRDTQAAVTPEQLLIDFLRVSENIPF